MISRNVPAFMEKYSDVQRIAVAESMADHGRTAKRTAELAAAGELVYQGERLEPFKITPSYVNDLKRDLLRRRTGQVKSELAAQPPRDAIEALRRRLVNAADSMLAVHERQVAAAVKKGALGNQTIEQGRQIARLILEASRLPGPSDPRPAPETRRDPRTGERVETHGGLAGSLIKAHRGERQTRVDVGASNEVEKPEPPEQDSGPDGAGPDDPAAFMAAQVARMSG